MKELPFSPNIITIYGAVNYIDPTSSDVWITVALPGELNGEIIPFLATPETAPYLPDIYSRGDEVEGKAHFIKVNGENRLRLLEIDKQNII